MKLKKIIAALSAAAIMSIGCASIFANAEAAPASTDADLARFSPSKTYASITNNTNSVRYMEAFIAVYNENTNRQVTSFSGYNTGGYLAYADASNNTYGSNGYDFKVWGYLYNTSSPSSGVAWSSGVYSYS